MRNNVKKSNCTACNYEIDSATSFQDERASPNSGDISICLQCGHLMAFADDLSLRDLTDKEIVEIAGMPEIVRLNNARAKVMKNPTRGAD